MKIVPFKPEHIRAIETQAAQIADDLCTDNNSEEYANWVSSQGTAITGLGEDGEVLFCFGQVTLWDNRHMAWATLSKKAAGHMVKITKVARRAIACSGLKGRTEAIVRAEFESGHRWMELLGFSFHHYEEKFLPDGGDARIYVRFS